jgi:hypothetical protein
MSNMNMNSEVVQLSPVFGRQNRCTDSGVREAIQE